MTYDEIVACFNWAVKKAVQDFKYTFKKGENFEWCLMQLMAVRQHLKDLQNIDPDTYDLLMEIMDETMPQEIVVEKVGEFLHYMRLHAK